MKLLAEGMGKLRTLIEDATRMGYKDAHCASLATATPEGKPSVRTVFIERVEDQGLVFCVNTQSGKGQQMLANPQVALSFYWPESERQVNIDGLAVLLSPEASDDYWATRSRESQLGAWVSDQPQALDHPDQLKAKLKEARQQFSFEQVPRPQDWRAFRVEPVRLEFWDSNWGRLKGRDRFFLDEAGRWQRECFQP